jgi:hypothetical protein
MRTFKLRTCNVTVTQPSFYFVIDRAAENWRVFFRLDARAGRDATDGGLNLPWPSTL